MFTQQIRMSRDKTLHSRIDTHARAHTVAEFAWRPRSGCGSTGALPEHLMATSNVRLRSRWLWFTVITCVVIVLVQVKYHATQIFRPSKSSPVNTATGPTPEARPPPGQPAVAAERSDSLELGHQIAVPQRGKQKNGSHINPGTQTLLSVETVYSATL